MTRSPDALTRIEGWLSAAGPARAMVESMVAFLAQHLDVVTGDPDALLADAAAWRAAAEKVKGLIDDEEAARTLVLGHWEGAAAEAFNQELGSVSRSLRDVATHFTETAESLEAAAEGVREAEELVAQIIKELIAWLIITLIVALASAYITAGASVVAGAAAGALQTGQAAARGGQVAVRLARLLKAMESFLMAMSNYAKAYKLTKIGSVGVRDWMVARYGTKAGYELLATNWVIKKTIVEPTVGKPLREAIGADGTVNWPSIL